VDKFPPGSPLSWAPLIVLSAVDDHAGSVDSYLPPVRANFPLFLGEWISTAVVPTYWEAIPEAIYFQVVERR